METYDIYFRDEQDSANKGFNLKDKEKAIRMAEDMLAEKKGYVKDFPGGIISVIDKSQKKRCGLSRYQRIRKIYFRHGIHELHKKRTRSFRARYYLLLIE